MHLISCLLSFLKYLFSNLTYIEIHLFKFRYLQCIPRSQPTTQFLHRVHGDMYLWGVIVPTFFLLFTSQHSSSLQIRNEYKRVYFLVVFLTFHAKTFLSVYFKNLHCLSIYFPRDASILKMPITLIFSTWIILFADEKRLCSPGPPCLVVCSGSQIRHCPCCLPLSPWRLLASL